MLHSLKLYLRKTLPFKIYLQLQYIAFYKQKLSLYNPKRFSEKMYCCKILNKKNKELYQRCYDKYRVRKYVNEKTTGKLEFNILNEMYGVYESPDDIPFEKLPKKFVLKVTQSSGYNIICTDKDKLNIMEAKKKLHKWLNDVNEHFNNYDESYLFDGKAKIICERLLEDQNGCLPKEYKVYCFNGEPKLIVNVIGITQRDGSHGTEIIRNTYSMDWELLEVDLGRPRSKLIQLDKPSNISDIYTISKILSEDFPFVRVDLYDVDGKLYFGELTWIPMGGNCIIFPKEYDDLFGSWLEIDSVDKG